MSGQSQTIYAHTLGPNPADWEPLRVHADDVAKRAADFASAFGTADWGWLVGLWHDLGKRSIEFQDYIVRTADIDASERGHGPDHSTFGARYALAQLPDLRGQLLAFCIAGHHAGLADATTTDDSSARSTLSHRLDPSLHSVPPVAVPTDPDATRAAAAVRLPAWLGPADPLGFAVAFFARMIFSALVDADRTATEAFCDTRKAGERSIVRPDLAALRAALDAFLDHKQRHAPPTPVNAVRARVLRQCVTAAARPPGFFSLNVPTGGGKTFASLAFALHHAAAHPALRRVVVAIPFTSIIEQTADQYRQALGPLAHLGLVEHHSSLNPKVDTRANKLAAENWDAPLVVTTNVQLFDSLFAAAGTPARKLHRLAHSVIVLDEAQTMPIDLLTATLAALRELVARYGCTVVLCTATQPALERRPGEFKIGIDAPHPIVADAPALHAELKRVEVERVGVLDDAALVERLSSKREVLCVVNTKAHAAAVYDGLIAAARSADGCVHLSTLMCAQHRRDVLRRVRRTLLRNRLAAARGQTRWPCRVVSTQLIEAGVDVDFPAVYRASAGFDSIAQSAGRCNREGRLLDRDGRPALGQVVAFDTESLPPPGLLRQAADVAAELSSQYPDPLAPSAVEAYFRHLYWKRSHEWDKHGVMACFAYDRHDQAHAKLARFQFRTAAEAYQLIRDEQTPILVPYNKEAKALVAHVVEGRPIDRDFYRAAQKYTVAVRDHFLQRLADNTVLTRHEAGLYVLNNPKAYSPAKGLLPDVAGMDPEVLVV